MWRVYLTWMVFLIKLFCILTWEIFFPFCFYLFFGTVDGMKKRVARAGHLLNTYPELRTVIASKTSASATMPSPTNGTKDENTDERKRKLARMEMVRDMMSSENKAPTIIVSLSTSFLFDFLILFFIIFCSFLFFRLCH